MPAPRSPLDPLVVGVDLGNATTAVARPCGVQAFFPSVLTTRNVRPHTGLQKISTSLHQVTWNGITAVVGADALELRGADTLLNETAPESRYTDDQSMLCLLAGLSAAFPETDTLGVRLATGAPLSFYEAQAGAIRARYLGEHRYHYNGHARRVVVEDVRVYGEGAEALRLLPADQQRGNVAVHDLGGKTWNVLLFKDGAYRTYRTFDQGLERLLDDVPDVSRDVATRWGLLGELRRDAKAHSAIRARLSAVMTEALHDIERKVALPKAGRHVLMGGGAPLLLTVVRQRYGVPAAVLNGTAPEAVNALVYAMAASEAA